MQKGISDNIDDRYASAESMQTAFNKIADALIDRDNSNMPVHSDAPKVGA
jgi:hypothetical protein